jgi:hypothetical protein
MMESRESDLDFSSEVSTMGCALRQPMRRLRLLITILAMMGMELDVLCNPFYPLQILRWIQPFDPDASDANGPPDVKALGSADRNAPVEKTPLDGQQSDELESRLQIHQPPEMHDLVALRSKTRSAALPLFSLCFKPVRPLVLVPLGYGPERHLNHPHRTHLVHQLCRMLC